MNSKEISAWKNQFTKEIYDYSFDIEVIEDSEIIDNMSISEGVISNVYLNDNALQVRGRENDIIVNREQLISLLEEFDNELNNVKEVLRDCLKDTIVIDTGDKFYPPSVISTETIIEDILTNIEKGI